MEAQYIRIMFLFATCLKCIFYEKQSYNAYKVVYSDICMYTFICVFSFKYYKEIKSRK